MSAAAPGSEGARPRLLLVSYRYWPEPYPLSIGLRGVIDRWAETYDLDVVTAAPVAEGQPGVRVHRVRSWSLRRAQGWARRLRLEKLAGLVVWPDPFWPWALPAALAARRIARARRPAAAVVFMMPFSTGLVGLLLKRLTGLPLVLNFDDSPTSSDIVGVYPTRAHAAAQRRFEDRLLRGADAAVYVSARNLARVGARQPAAVRERLALVRCAVTPSSPPPAPPPPDPAAPLRVVYTGALSGWHALDAGPRPPVRARAYRAWLALGTYRPHPHDARSHSPVFVGQAAARVAAAGGPSVEVHTYGNTYPRDLVDRVLGAHGVAHVVTVHPPVPHGEVAALTAGADVLFLTLSDRPDGSPGDVVSLKTYEYLATDRPILAAVPPGENRDVLAGQPGVTVVAPTDVDAMAEALGALAARKRAGASLAVARPGLGEALSAAARADRLAAVVEEVAGLPPSRAVDRSDPLGAPPPRATVAADG